MLGRKAQDPGVNAQNEGSASTVSTEPVELISWAEVTKNILVKSAVDVIPAIRRGLGRTGARLSERLFAQGGAGFEGLFTAGGVNEQVASGSGGQADSDLILELPKGLIDFEGGGDPVWALSRYNWYDFVRTLTKADEGYVFGGNRGSGAFGTPGMSSIKVIDSNPAYFCTYAPRTTGASDYYLIHFHPSAFLIHDYDVLEITRDDSFRFLSRKAVFLMTRWTDSAKIQNNAFVSVQGNSS